jgi:hypothetical protein
MAKIKKSEKNFGHNIGPHPAAHRFGLHEDVGAVLHQQLGSI